METMDATIYLVDDDADVRESVSRLLRSAGWATRTFPSAAEFLAAQPIAGIGCLVLDVSMPGMSGPDLHATLESYKVSFPVIYLSGNCDIPTSVVAMRRGALDVLEKPVDADTLLAAVSAAVDQHRQDSLHRDVLDDVKARMQSLSPRELEVMRHVIIGRLNKQIADDMGIVEKTVKVHRGRVMAKMRVRSVAQLVLLCADVPPDSID